jgi:hypothetical protein
MSFKKKEKTHFYLVKLMSRARVRSKYFISPWTFFQKCTISKKSPYANVSVRRYLIMFLP